MRQRELQTELKIIIHTAKPGVVIGKGGAEIEALKKQVEKLTSC